MGLASVLKYVCCSLVFKARWHERDICIWASPFALRMQTKMLRVRPGSDGFSMKGSPGREVTS